MSSPSSRLSDTGDEASDREEAASQYDPESPQPPPPQRGRPRGSGSAPSGSAAPKRKNGVHGARGMPSPLSNPLPDGKRPRPAAGRYDPAAEDREGKRRAREAARQREAAVQLLPDDATLVDLQSLARDISASFCCKECGAAVHPRGASTSKGSISTTLEFACVNCGDKRSIGGGAKVRLRLKPPSWDEGGAGEAACGAGSDEDKEDEEDDDADDDNDDNERRRNRPRTFANKRSRSQVDAVLSTLYTGGGFQAYEDTCTHLGLKPLQRDAFYTYLSLLWPHVEALTEEYLAMGRIIVFKYGDVGSFVATADAFWENRGLTSHNATGTICDSETGAVLEREHCCQRGDKLSGIVPYEGTPQSMDGYSFDVMLRRFVGRFEGESQLAAAAAERGIEPNFYGVVMDGDVTSETALDGETARRRSNALGKSVDAAAARFSQTNYCRDIKKLICVNHLAKRCGKQAYLIGKSWHTCCSCAVKLNADLRPQAKGQRLHRGCNSISDPLVKAYQRAMGAALRGALTWSAKPGYEGRALIDIAKQGVEEALLHLQNEHAGVGPFSGAPRHCRLHDHTADKPYTARNFNDCVDFNRDMERWVRDNVYNKLDVIIHPTRGGLSQNASERIGRCVLQLRSKLFAHFATHYCLSTDLGIQRAQSIVLEVVRRRLEAAGLPADLALERLRCPEVALRESLGLNVPERSRRKWEAQLLFRAKQSEMRRGVAFKRKRKVAKANLTQKRAARRAGGHEYKGCLGGAARCGCKGGCADRRCGCRKAGRQCTPRCSCKMACANGDGAANSSAAHAAAADQAAREARLGISPPPADADGDDNDEPEPLEHEWLETTESGDFLWACEGRQVLTAGTVILYKFPDFGWCIGHVEKAASSRDSDFGDPSRRAWWQVFYDDDDDPRLERDGEIACHALPRSDYCDSADADDHSWCILDVDRPRD